MPIALLLAKLLPLLALFPKTLVYLVLMPKLSLVGTPSVDWFCCPPQLLGCLLNRRGDGGAPFPAVDPFKSKLENLG